jgi:hypothetical protein
MLKEKCEFIVKQIIGMKENSALIFETKNTKCEEFYKFLSNHKPNNSDIINSTRKIMVTKKCNNYQFKEIF